MSLSTLPPNPNFDQLKFQAKDLLKAHKSADPRAALRLRHSDPDLTDRSDAEIFRAKFALKDAQRIIAREYGFDKWADLKGHVESMQRAGGSASAEVETICRAVEAGEVETVAALLKANPALATLQFADDHGEIPRPTLLHRVADRVGGKKKASRYLQIARLLIDHGANVNAVVDGYSPPLVVAVWQRHHVDMVELLLGNGADPNLGGIHGKAIDQQSNRAIFKCLVEAGAAYGIEHTIDLGMVKETRALLDADPSLVNKPTPGGALPLNLAAGKQRIFELLLRCGADVHARDGDGYTPLMAARSAGNGEALQELLQRGVPDDIFGAILERDAEKVAAILAVDPSQAHPRGDGPAPIIWAVRSGSMPIVESLLEQGVEVHIFRSEPGEDPESPLTKAIRCQHDDMIRLLLEYGADADPEPEDCRSWPGATLAGPYGHGYGVNPLVNATSFGTLRAAEMLLDAGADPNRETDPVIDKLGLGWPANRGDLVRARLLLDRGADLRRPAGRRALAIAAEMGHTPMVELFGTHGVDVEAAYQLGDEKGRPPLDRALKAGHAETADLLREFVVLNGQPKAERDPMLHRRGRFIDALIDGDAGIVRELLEQDPTLGQRELIQVDLFHHIAYAGHQAVADVLVEYGASWTSTAAVALGRTAEIDALLDANPALLKGPDLLLTATIADNSAAIELLLDRGADINAATEDGKTALHYAVNHPSGNSEKFCLRVENVSMKALEVLLGRGAEVNIQDGYGNTPLRANASPWNTGATPKRRKIHDLLVSHGAVKMNRSGVVGTF